MIRTITGFHCDDEEWVVDLSCLHRHRVRQRSLFADHSWVTDSVERRQRVGSRFECVPCDRAELPDDLAPLRTAGPWDYETLPEQLRNPHRINEGVWGVARVLNGSVKLSMRTVPPVELVLHKGTAQPLPPDVTHELRVIGEGRVVLEFWGRPARRGSHPST